MNKTSKPTWNTLYAIGAVCIAVMFIVPSLSLSEDMQKVAFFFIMAALCVSMGLWISDNPDGLELEKPSREAIQHKKGYYTLNPGKPSARTSANDHEKEVA